MTPDDPAQGPSRQRALTIVGAVASVALLAATLAIVVDRRRAPDAADRVEPTVEQPAADAAAVVLQLPAALVADGSTAPVAATAYGDGPIDALELWVDGELVDTAALDAEGATAGWDWDPPPGQRVVLARAVAGGDVVGESPPSWVDVVDPAADGGGEGAPGTGDAAGDPVAAPEGRSGGDGPVALRDCVLEGGAPGTRLRVAWPGVGRFQTVAPSSASASPSMVVPGGEVVAYVDGPDGPTAPQRFEVPGDCAPGEWTGDLRLVDGIVELDEQLPPGVSGLYLYVSVDGGPAVRFPPADHSSVPLGPDGFDVGGLVPPLRGRTVDVEAWGRIGNGAVPVGRGQLALGDADLSPLEAGAALDLALATAQRTDLDWIVQREKEAGNCEMCFALPEVLARTGVLADDGTTLGVAEQMAPDGVGTSLLDFRYAAIDPSVTHVAWQVSAGPMPSAPLLDFPGLLATQSVAGAAGEITIDVDAIWHPDDGGATASMADASLGALTAVASATPQVVLPANAAGPTTTTTAATGVAASSLFVDEDLLATIADLLPSSLWVRVVPFAGSQPLSVASNPVTFSIDQAEAFTLAPSPPGLAPMDVSTIEVDFVPPHEPNDAYGRCVRVVENPHGSENPALLPSIQFRYDEFEPAGVGDTVCAKYQPPPSPSWFDTVVSSIGYVASLWDEAVALVKELKEKVVEIAASLGCKQLAESHWNKLPQATKDDLKQQGIDGPVALCKKMIGTAIDVYLTANGIPPSLPTSEDLADAAKGELSAVIAKKAAELCPDLVTAECEEEARKIVDEVLDKVQEGVSDSAKAKAAGGDWKLYLADDIEVVPEPAGQFQPAFFRVTVNLASPAPEDRTCGFLGRVRGTHPAWTYIKPTSASSSKIVTEEISGPVMVPATGSVHVPAGATTATGVVVVPDLDRSWHPVPSDHWNSDPFWWAWFDQQATLTMQLTGGCPGSDQQAIDVSSSFGPIDEVGSPAEVELP